MVDADRGVLAGYTPLKDPAVDSGFAGTDGALMCADHPGNRLHNVRRVRVYNTHATQILGVALLARGADPSTASFANSVKIPPGQVWAAAIDAKHRLVVIASAATTGYNYLVDDV
jgi:hypothetical protein